MNTKIFTDSLVSCFNEKLGTHRLCADFSREAHPGHSENDVSDWKFAMEETVGAFPLRRMSPRTLRYFISTTSLTNKQIPLSLFLRK